MKEIEKFQIVLMNDNLKKKTKQKSPNILCGGQTQRLWSVMTTDWV